jgi:hypothetical protein
MSKRKTDELSEDDLDPLDVIDCDHDETIPLDDVIRDEIVPEALKANPGSTSFIFLLRGYAYTSASKSQSFFILVQSFTNNSRKTENEMKKDEQKQLKSS